MPLPFDPFSINLPVREIIPEVQRHLVQGNTLIVMTPPGAGKSTLLPLALLDQPWLQGKKIIMLEPRRLAASTIAQRMATLLGEKAGLTVGYRIRFENQTSSLTRLEVVTEGILTRMLHQDNALEDVGLIIFDEFHERRLHTELAMAFCREIQQVLRPELRIMVMSATLDTTSLADLLRAPVVHSEGKLHPIAIIHTTEADIRQLAESCAQTVIRAANEKTGDILVFLPGEGEIRKCENILQQHLQGIAIHPLYGKLSNAAQRAAILPAQNGQRKVVLATSIAETSLTIAGIAIVVDSGYTRTLSYDTRSSLSRLKTTRISIDAADQRAGRAGRLGPGTCYRLWSMATHHRMAPYRTPEILDADLAPLVLDLTQWGISQPQQLSWLTSPPTGPLSQANDILNQLGVVENGKITPHGKQVHALPCHPRIAHMLVMSKQHDQVALATDIAALLEERDPLGNVWGVDINLRIAALRRHRLGSRQGKNMENIDKIARSYRKLLDIEADNSSYAPHETGLLLAYAYPERIAKAKQDGEGRFILANGKSAIMDASDDLANHLWLAIAQIDARESGGKIFLAAPLNPTDLQNLIKENDRIVWSTAQGGIVASRDKRIGAIVLASKALSDITDQQALPTICDAIRSDGRQLLSFTDAVEQWQNRVLSLQKWRPQESWPDVDTASLLMHPEDWLYPYLRGVRKVDELKKIDLLEALRYSLEFEKQQRMETLAPVAIKVPSGSTIKLRYSPHGDLPILAVRLQEIFGLLNTPMVNDGQTPVVIHLLSPGFKPVQVTTDLNSFWQNTYFEVRKELKRRYPKHSWPEDPLQATAVSGARRKK